MKPLHSIESHGFLQWVTRLLLNYYIRSCNTIKKTLIRNIFLEIFTHLEMSPLIIRAVSLTCARHSWPLSNEEYLTCHTYSDSGQPFIMIISKVTHTCCRAFGSGAVTTCFNDFALSRRMIEPWSPACKA